MFFQDPSENLIGKTRQCCRGKLCSGAVDVIATGKVQHHRQLVKHYIASAEEHQNNDCPFCT